MFNDRGLLKNLIQSQERELEEDLYFWLVVVEILIKNFLDFSACLNFTWASHRGCQWQTFNYPWTWDILWANMKSWQATASCFMNLRTKSTNADITAHASLTPYSLPWLRQFEIFFTGDNNSRLVLRLLILCIIAGWLHIRDQEYLRPWDHPGRGVRPGDRGARREKTG